MRIVVVSDTHKKFWSLQQIVEKHLSDTEMFIHLGDGEREYEEIKDMYPHKKFCYVKGNCDYDLNHKEVEIIGIEEYKIFITHGHIYGVKYDLERLKLVARQNKATIALYGHTHKSYKGYEDGLYIMNPGSPVLPRDSKPSYGTIDITKAGIVLNIILIQP
ncbi:MAG: phosphoesterase, family [Oscillospiraceae bacterium]|nr:phosphoesterase, family [Oscillospiraceae bacterium]